MTGRLFITAALALLGVGLYFAGRQLHLWAVVRGGHRALPGLEGLRLGRPALLYFSTADCAPCQTMLKPALRQLTADLGDRVQVVEVDAEKQTKAARHWKVLSVPTIFVLDPQGRPRHVHYGLVRPEVLRNELDDWLA